MSTIVPAPEPRHVKPMENAHVPQQPAANNTEVLEVIPSYATPTGKSNRNARPAQQSAAPLKTPPATPLNSANARPLHALKKGCPPLAAEPGFPEKCAVRTAHPMLKIAADLTTRSILATIVAQDPASELPSSAAATVKHANAARTRA